jgi:integrase
MNDKDIIAARPKSKRYEIWDDQVKGLHVRILPDGAKSFHLRYKIGARYRKGKIGTYRAAKATTTQISLKQARENAKAKLELAASGIDPFLETLRKIEQEEADAAAKAARKTFSQLADDYIEIYSKPKKKSWKEDQRILTNDVVPLIGDMALEDIRKAEINDVIDKIIKRGSRISADHCFRILRAVFNWAASKGYGDIEFSPMYGMKAPGASKPRERVLSDEEIRSVWDWIETGSIHDLTRCAFKLLLVTGQRPGDICGLQKADVTIYDGKPIWTIPGERYKNGMTHVVPLSDMAVGILEDVEQLKANLDYQDIRTYDPWDGVCLHCGKAIPERRPHPDSKYCSHKCRRDRAVLLRKAKREPRYINSPYVFQSEKRLNTPINPQALPRAIDRGRSSGGLAGIEHWTPHDLRRTCGTNITGLVKESQEIMDKVLGHKDRSIGATYNRYAYLTEKRRALDGWSRELRRILSRSSEEEGNVISLYR